MTLTEIKAAIEAGKRVYWKNPAYQVIKDRIGQHLVHCTLNDSYHGLTHRDGITVNGKPEDFHIEPHNQWMNEQ